MAHQIYENSMAFAGAVPWHGIGTKLPRNASVEEILEAARFYRVIPTSLHIPGQVRAVPGLRALVREDTGAFLAAVSERYEIVDAEDVARTLIEAAGGTGAIFHTAGLLGASGERFWLLAELPEVIRVRGDKSEIRPYLLGTSAHDGASPVLVLNCATRVVCSNTLGTALSERAQARWCIRHTRSAKQRLDEAARGFHELALGMKRFEQLANAMAVERFSDADLVATLNDVMPLPEDGKEHPRIERARGKVIELFDDGVGMTGIRGTAWGAFQSWTEFADHHRAFRGLAEGDLSSAKLESVWLGAAADLKRRALTAITNRVGISLAA